MFAIRYSYRPQGCLAAQFVEPVDGIDEEYHMWVCLLIVSVCEVHGLGEEVRQGGTFAGWLLLLRRPGRPDCYTLQSREGVPQGDPLAMVIYGLALSTLSLDLSVIHPRVLQPWYADDAAMEGRASNVAAAMASLVRAGPARGYFPSPEKSIVLVSPADQAAAKSHLEAFQFKYQAGARYLGSFLGDEGEWDAWLAA
jgi:hypothetical protein